jgi:hypothetical protein
VAREPGYAKYPAQITYSDTQAEADAIADEAKKRGISKADVVRELVAEGRAHRSWPHDA